MSRRLEQIPIAFDQLINTIFGGRVDETISSQDGENVTTTGDGEVLRRVIDAIFFWQKNHYQSAYESEKNRLPCPPELR